MLQPCLRGFVLLFAALLPAAVADADDPKAPELTAEEQKLAAEATKLNREGLQLYQRGQPAAAFVPWRQALEIRQKLYPAARYPDGQPDLAESLNNLGIVLQAMGQAEKAATFYQQSLDMDRKLYPAAKYPDGHSDLANSLNNLGFVLQAMGQAEKAANFFQQSLDMNRKLFPAARYPDGHPNLARSFNNLAALLEAMGQAEKATTFFQQSLDMRRKLYPVAQYPDGHHELATSFNNLGFVWQSMGQPEKAATFYQQSLDMKRKLFPAAKYPDGHPDLALSLNNMGSVLNAMGQAEKAATFYQQSLDMRRKLYPAAKYPDGHPELAASLNNLGYTLQAMGQAEKAATYFQQSLDMRRKVYPAAKYADGHPELANSLNNLGFVWQSMGQPEKAATFYQQSLDMVCKLYPAAKYPDGHPHVAHSLNNLGFVLQVMGQAEKAATFYQQSVDMSRKLYPAAKYPDGHPNLATGLNNLGFVFQAMGQAEKAATFYQQSLDMRRKLYPVAKYPDGHPDLTNSLNNRGLVLQAMGQAEKAATSFQQSLEMHQRLLQRELLTASESAAFDRIAAQPLYRDTYLSATRALNVAARDCYQAIAPSRSVVTRILEQRLASARVAGTAVADQIDQLKGNRRRTDQLLQDSRMNKDERDKLLVIYADERDTLERALLAAMPLLKRGRELDQLGPDALVQALPAGAVLIDLIAYTHFEYEKGKVKRISSYVAFVLAKTPSPPAPLPLSTGGEGGKREPLPRSEGEGSIVRIELGEANEIDAAVRSWRSAIESRGGDAAAGTLRERVWAKLVPHLPAGTKTLYLAADGDLARLPWAALPIGKDRVLLEDFAIAVVPHGTFLLDQLKFPRTVAGPESLFALGGVDYGPGIWPALPGTKVEMNAIVALAAGERIAASGPEATAAKLTTSLPKARWAHLATHGAFKADELTAERKRAAEALKSRQFGDDTHKIAAKNPLGYVGLVLADGDIMSGLSIVDLPLENLKLVTLSACETGLGEYTGGEGVQGLQRAFHLAGCPNVVASLWKVNDAATAALMAKFYHEMWVNKKPPIEALREAQLTIYRRPDLIPLLAAERGIQLEKALGSAGTQAVPADAPTTPTKLWAAFVLSGAGK